MTLCDFGPGVVRFHCGTRTRKVCRPQFQRTQRASGLRPSRRSLPRGLHGPDRELDRYATRSASAGGCRKSGWLTAASRRLPDRRVQNVWSVTVYVRSVLITSTVDPSKRYTRSYLAGGLARSSVPTTLSPGVEVSRPGVEGVELLSSCCRGIQVSRPVEACRGLSRPVEACRGWYHA